MHLNYITGEIIESALRAHNGLGPGMLESVYEKVLYSALTKKGFHVERQFPVSFKFDEMEFRNGFRIDLFVENAVIIEIKSIECIAPAHTKQLLTYLRLAKVEIGLLLNFGGATLKEGLRRVVNNYRPQSESEAV